jgi:3-deoxy-D-manno-octulosonate 8-phosphate phosphatase (KDO 8-P phosphatase)
MSIESPSLAERCRRIVFLLLDADGVLTDGRIIYDDRGGEWKVFHVRDGTALKAWRQCGKLAGVLSGRSSPALERRALELGLTPVLEGIDDKLGACRRLLSESHLNFQQLCYIGDDLPDVPVLTESGLAVAVADACPEVRSAAHYITRAQGGGGAVRETIELILHCQKLWPQAIELERNDQRQESAPSPCR